MNPAERERSLAADVLRSLVARFPNAADDAEFAEAALRDLLGDAYRRERALLVGAARAGIPARVRDRVLDTDDAPTFDANASDARWAVDAWRAAFGEVTQPKTVVTVPSTEVTVPRTVVTTPKSATAKPNRARPAIAWLGVALIAGALGFVAFRPHPTTDYGLALASPTPEATATPMPLATTTPHAYASPQPRRTSIFDAIFKVRPSPKATRSAQIAHHFDGWSLFTATTAPRTPAPTLEPQRAATAPPARSVSFARPVQTHAPGSSAALPVRSFGYAPGADLSDASAELGECIGAWRNHDWTAAKAACARAAAAAPNDPEPVLLLGESYYGCRCYDGALAPLSRVIADVSATSSQKLEAYRYRGFVDYELYDRYGDTKDLEWAYYDFGGALDIDDRDPTTMFDYASSAYTLHRWCSAQRAFATLASRYPDDRESAYWRDAAAAAANREGCS